MIDYINNLTPLMLIIIISIVFSILLFFLGLWLIVWAVQFHFVVVLLILDFLLLSNITLFAIFTVWTANSLGYSLIIFTLAVAACDTVIGLGLFISLYRSTRFFHF